MTGTGGPQDLDRAAKRLARERKARLEAESIAERVTAELYAAVKERERVNAELSRTNSELEDANRAIKDFVAIASHDIRGPLTSILGFTQLLRGRWEALEDERKREFLAVIDDQGRRVQRLVEDLLTVSKLEAGTVELHIQEIAIEMELERTVHELGEDARLVGVDAPSGLRVLADPDHVQRILVNYLSNALKYGAPPIDAQALDCGAFAEVRVRDLGEGVPPDFVERLFGRFSRADTQQTREKKGTGLGLAIVRGLAQANGGDAWYEPNAPRGSCFAVRLPKA